MIDDRTIQIVTTQPGATTLQLIGGPVLSRAYYGKDYQRGKLDGVRAFNGKPLGNGPYIYDKYVPGQEIRFHANPNFYLGTPPMARFIYRVTNPATNFQLFQTGETDYDAFTAKPDDIEQLCCSASPISTFTARAITAALISTSSARRCRTSGCVRR